MYVELVSVRASLHDTAKRPGQVAAVPRWAAVVSVHAAFVVVCRMRYSLPIVWLVQLLYDVLPVGGHGTYSKQLVKVFLYNFNQSIRLKSIHILHSMKV